MYQEAIKLKDVLNCTLRNSIIVVDFIDIMLGTQTYKGTMATSTC